MLSYSQITTLKESIFAKYKFFIFAHTLVKIVFSKILIANRGEIAVRIIRACREMGISTVAVFSVADKEALHVSLADESYCIGPAAGKDSYLNMQAIITTAVLSGAEAIHPGYGFLSENHKFAKLCKQCNITFIGPSSEVIFGMGDKNNARMTMEKAGVPITPGCKELLDYTHALIEAKKIGYPVLIKASAGGGGRGIRLVNNESELEKAFLSAKSEAKACFGNDSLYMEKYLTNVKHIELQILADNFGNVIVLPERECSIQRKNQKLIEESPSCIIDEQTRNEMIESSILACRAANYTNIGTIEYLYIPETKKYYFMEMNTRLQVEHGVSEMISGIDIVKWQIRIAANIKLNFSQQDLRVSGHAIECRINAENPKTNVPSCGKISLLHIPGGPWVRFDSALYQGYQIPPFYDSMIGKIIVYAGSREECIRKMQSAIGELVIEGIDHNSDIFSDILSSETFSDGTYTTSFMSKRGD